MCYSYSIVGYIQAKLAKSAAILWKTKHILDYKSLHTLYYSLFLPYLTYCVEVWGNTYKTTLQPICTIQKRALRTINKAGYRDHTNPLFIKSHMLKFLDLVKFRTAQIMYKARNNLLPKNIQGMFSEREGGYNLRGDLNLKKPKVRTNMKSMCVSSCGVTLWNSLETEIKQSANINLFKKRYKKIFLNQYMAEEVC